MHKQSGMVEGHQLSSFLAGTFAGASGILVGHPFDTLKVRYQVGQTSPSQSTVAKGIRELYRGITPPLLTAGVVQSINFSLYELFKRKLRQRYNLSHLSSVFCGGFSAGTLISFMTSPISCVKLQQQLSTTKGIIACSMEMYKMRGLRSFYRGFGPFFIMESYGRGVYLFIYERTKLSLRSQTIANEETLPIRMAAAATAGCLSWLSVFPLDVIKSRMQLDLTGIKYKSTLGCAISIYKEHGYRGFFRGLSFTMIRAAPVASTILPIYEFSKDQIEKMLIT
jgi:solute carrier family 25 (mitochondrial carnitine/acylcarnitine transporter), member 20/29